MPDPAIQAFLSERKAAWLKKNILPNMGDEERIASEQIANEKFDLANWLPDAAKRSGQLSMVSHPGKFTHPSAKTSSVIANAERKADGFLRTGNAHADFDVFGNAAALDVYKFLSLTLEDGQTVLAHLEQNSEQIQAQLKIPAVPFAELQQGLLAIKPNATETAKTSEKIKQVYFPVDDDYHLLSILTPSGLMFKLKQRINDIRFSDEAKLAREDRRNQLHNEQGFAELYNLTVIGFGGTKPQNISVLNSNNMGTSYLLASMPPQLELRATRLPSSNFFLQSLYAKDYQENFEALQRLWVTDYNTINIRDGIDNRILMIVDQVMEKVWTLRELESGWSENTTLPPAQKIWLDSAYNEQREVETDWLENIITSLADWLRINYKKAIGDQAMGIGDIELRHINELLAEYKEVLL